MKGINSFDPIWEQKYASGHAQRYPWDVVVSFVFRNAQKDQPRSAVSILEVGCGTGANMWFAAREGFRVAGIDASTSAIATARQWFAKESLAGDFQVADFTSLPFVSNQFDLIIDREALCCCGEMSLMRAVNEIHRVMKTGGRFLFNAYADDHSSFKSGKKGPDGLVTDINKGTLVGAGHIRPTSRTDIDKIFANSWKILSLDRNERKDMLADAGDIHSEWVVIAEKT